MQNIDDIMDKNKNVLERLRGEVFKSSENMDIFYRAKTKIECGYPVYGLVEINGKIYEGELIEMEKWTTTEVLVKTKDGNFKININDIKILKS